MDRLDPGNRGAGVARSLGAAFFLAAIGVVTAHGRTSLTGPDPAYDTAPEAMKHLRPRPPECVATGEGACVPTFLVEVSLDGGAARWRPSRWEWADSPGLCLDERATRWSDCSVSAPSTYRIDRRVTAMTIATVGDPSPAYPTTMDALEAAPPPPAGGCENPEGAGVCAPAFTVASLPPDGKLAWRFTRWVSAASPGVCMDDEGGSAQFLCNRPAPGAWRLDVAHLTRPIAAGFQAYDSATKAKRHLLPVPDGCRDAAGAIVCIPSFLTEVSSDPPRISWRPSVWVSPMDWGDCVDDAGKNLAPCQDPPIGFERIQTPSPPMSPPVIEPQTRSRGAHAAPKTRA